MQQIRLISPIMDGLTHYDGIKNSVHFWLRSRSLDYSVCIMLVPIRPISQKSKNNGAHIILVLRKKIIYGLKIFSISCNSATNFCVFGKQVLVLDSFPIYLFRPWQACSELRLRSARCTLIEKEISNCSIHTFFLVYQWNIKMAKKRCTHH